MSPSFSTSLARPGPSPADNWVAIAWDGMQARGSAAVLYFLAWIILGNFMLLTLFLAILITNFQVRPSGK